MQNTGRHSRRHCIRRDVASDDSGDTDDGFGADADSAHGFGAISHEDTVFEKRAFLAAMGEDEADIRIEVAVGTDDRVGCDDDAHRVGEAESGADGGFAADFDFEEPEQDLAGHDAWQAMPSAPELEADESHRMDAVQGQAKGGTTQR